MEEDYFKVTLRGAPLEEAELVLVLLHGFGAVVGELARPADEMLAVLRKHEERAAAKTAVVLPEGPLGEGDLRAWWNMSPPSNVKDLDAIARDTKPPEELVDRLAATVYGLLQSCPSPPVVVLGGLSQGAFLALHGLVALRMMGVNAAGLLAMAGFLHAPTVRLAADMVPDMPDDEPSGPLRVFVAHGEDDEVIPEMAVHPGISAVRDMKAKTVCGVELESFFHEGGHELGDGTAAAAGRWLRSMVRPKPAPGATEAATATRSAPPAVEEASEPTATSTRPLPREPPQGSTGSVPQAAQSGGSSSSTAGVVPTAVLCDEALASSRETPVGSAARAGDQAHAAPSSRMRNRPWHTAAAPSSSSTAKPRHELRPDEKEFAQTGPTGFVRGGDEEGEFRPGDMVRMRGLRSATHLNGARGVLEAWDDESCTWELEVQTTHEHVFVKPERMERFVSEDERRRRAARRSLPKLSAAELAELRRASIPDLFDAPQLHRVFWGSAGAPRPRGAGLPAGSEIGTVGGLQCLFFGMDLPRSNGEPPPTVMIFHGRCFDIAEAMSRVARAYVNSSACAESRGIHCRGGSSALRAKSLPSTIALAGIGARVVLPVGAIKTSRILDRARELVAGLPRDLQQGPLVVHGVFTGSIPAVQVAAEQSQHDVASAHCQVLVLEQGISSIDQIPGVVGVIGGVQNDPLCQELKLRMTRCHIVLVEGVKEKGPFQQVDTVRLVAQSCATPPTVLREETCVTKGLMGEELLPELRMAVLQGVRFGSVG